MSFLLNVIFWLSWAVVSVVYIPPVTLVVALLALVSPYRTTLRRTRRAISWYGWLIIHSVWPLVKIEYRDFDTSGAPGPFVFVCNHRAASDAFLMACLPYECIQIINVWPSKIPFLGWFMKLAEYLSVHEMALPTFYEKTGQLLDDGVCLISFPEGTRSGSREMGAFTSSIFRVVIEKKATISPVAIAGNENIPPKGSAVLHPGRIKIHKLSAVTYGQYQDMSVFKLKNHIRDILQSHLQSVEEQV